MAATAACNDSGSASACLGKHTMETKAHWEHIYSSRTVTEVSWFQEHAALSLQCIREANILPGQAIIDVGGGASTLADDLVDAGHRQITVLDLSAAALAAAQQRMGENAGQVRWMEADILDVELERHAYDVWHDRAVFHFLTSPQARERYVQTVLHAVKPGGLVIVATFAEDGPEQCSGLPVVRYSAGSLHGTFGEPFILLGHKRESHRTPGGKEQRFIYCFCRKTTS